MITLPPYYIHNEVFLLIREYDAALAADFMAALIRYRTEGALPAPDSILWDLYIYDVFRHLNRYTETDSAQIKYLYDKGTPVTKIAKLLSISVSGVYSRLDEYNKLMKAVKKKLEEMKE